MSSETHEIRLVAKDLSSNVFKMAGSNAERMNQQIERSNQRTKRSWEDVANTARKATAAVAAGTTLAISAANKSEVSQQRLRQSIENTGKSYDEYADAVDRASKASIKKAFDDEDAADSISKLIQATNDAGKAIKDLSIAEDVARGRGISLSSATDIVVAAEQGRIGSLRRMGIAIDDNATKEEALAALQQKYTGQADAYAQTNAATWDRARIQAENALESIGAKLAAHQTEILAASSAWTAFGGALTSVARTLGASGFAQLLSFGGLAALGVTGGMAASTWGQAGSTPWNQLWGSAFGAGESALNWALPGNPFHAQQWNNALNANTIEDAVKGLFFGIDGTHPNQILALLQRIGAIGSDVNVANLDQTQQDAYLNNVRGKASAAGLTTGQYISTLASAPSSRFVLDPVSGQYIDAGIYPSIQRQREGLTNAGATQGPSAAGFYSANTKAAAGNYPSASSMGSDLAQQTQALKAQYGEWYHLADGEVTAKDALEAFGLAQQNVLKVESKYSGQLSEYSGQLNALQAAYDEVNAKKESGAQLTAKETQFLDGYTAANERLTGGVYDSTLAMGIQAEQYASNMTAADEFKSASDGVTGSINDLIAALAGIPGYVKTTVEADTSQFWAAITPLLGQQIGSAYINVYANRIGFGAMPEQHGGLTMAQHGYAGTSRSIMVGEAGPEILDISGGSTFVTPAAASKFSNKKRKMDGGDIIIQGGTFNITANNPRQLGDALRSYALAGSRN